MPCRMTGRKERRSCNFAPKVLDHKAIYASNGEIVDHQIELQLNFENEIPSSAFSVSLSEIEQLNWTNVDYRCQFHPETKPAVVARQLASCVREQLEQIPVRKVYALSQVGLYCIEGEPVFCTGGEIIRSPHRTTEDAELEITAQKCTDRLDFDPELTEADAASKMLELISLSPDPGRLLVAQRLAYFIRQAYEDAGRSPRICLFLYGRTGTQKTTYSSFLLQTYDRGDGIKSPTRLTTSLSAAVQMIMDTRDDVVVFDDLCPADSRQIRHKQEEVLTEITRLIGDGAIPARIKANKVDSGSPQSGVLFTGEYVIGTGSDAARLLPVEMMQPDGERLRYFQERPLIVSTFYRNFLLWFVENYQDIVELLRERLVNYRKSRSGVNDRLKETHFFLNTGYFMLLQYLFDRGYLTKHQAAQLQSSFSDLLTYLVLQQEQRIQLKASITATEPTDYLRSIQKAYRENQLSVASDAALFSEQMHDGVIHNNCLYLRKEALSQLFPSTDLDAITDALIAQDALRVGKTNKTKQISSLHGKRFYVIPLTAL